MPISLPDSTKFDADSDKISTSRAELKKISDAVNTLATEWNNQGDTFGGGNLTELLQDLDVNGQKIISTTNDSAGNDDIILETSAAGDIYLTSGNVYIGNPAAGAVIGTTNDTPVTIETNDGLGSYIRINAPSDDIEIKTDTFNNSNPIYLNGFVKFASTGGTPSNTTTPASWLEVNVGGTTYYLGLYS